MKTILLFLLLLLHCIDLNFAAPSTFSDNGHTYEYIPDVFSWGDAQTAATLAGGYLATITTQNEYYFIKNTVMGGMNYFAWIGGHSADDPTREKFLWKTGPEAGTPIYSRKFNKCYSFCAFLPYQPDIPNSESYLHFWNQGQINDVVYNWTGIQGYILEKGGNDKPYMVLPDTDAETITFNNLGSYKTSSLNINVQSLSGKTSFVCNVLSYTLTTATCIKPYTMSGLYNITISDGILTPFVMINVHPNLPMLSSVVPNYKQGEKVTINGENFSDNINELSLKLSVSLVDCTSIVYLIPHRSLTCVLASNIFASYSINNIFGDFYTIGVNSIVLNNGTRVPHLNTDKNTMVMYTANTFADGNINYVAEGILAYWFPIYDTQDLQFVSQLWGMVPQLACYPYNYLPSTAYTIRYGSQSGTIFISDAQQCILPLTDGCSVDPSVAIVNASLPLALGLGNNTFYSMNSTYAYANSGCRYLMGFSAVNSPPYFSNTGATYRVPTSGGLVSVDVIFLKMPYESYTATWTGGVISSQVVPIYIPKTFVRFMVPPGVNSPTQLKINVAGVNTTNINLLGYLSPTLTAVSGPSPIEGSVVYLDGDNLGATVDTLSVTVTNPPNSVSYTATNVVMVIQHKRISFTLHAGTGTYKVQVRVGDQSSNMVSQLYVAPIISNVIQNDTLFTMTATNIGTNSSLAQIFMNDIVTTDLEIIDQSTIRFNLSGQETNGNFKLVVNGIPSNLFPFILTPYLMTCGPTPSSTGGSVNCFGSFMDGTNQVFFNGGSVQTFTVVNPGNVLILVPPGQGISIPIYFTTSSGKITNTISYFYIPQLSSFYHDGSSVIILYGLNMDPGSKAQITTSKGTVAIMTNFVSMTQVTYSITNSYKSSSVGLLSASGIRTSSISVKLTPFITSVTSVAPISPLTGGKITINGNWLATTNELGSNLTTIVTIGSYSCASPTTLSTENTQLSCIVPEGSGANLLTNVTINGVANNGTTYFSYDAPVLSLVTQNITDRTITVSGTNFGPLSNIQVQLNSINLTNCVEIVKGSQLICKLIQSSSSGTIILLAGGQGSNSIEITLVPEIISMIPIQVSDTLITITGYFFRNTTSLSYSGKVGTTSCSTIRNIPNTDTIECTLPTPSPILNATSTPNIYITIGTKQSNSIPFAFSSPSISSFTQPSFSKLVVQGMNLGSTGSMPTVTLNSEVLICNFDIIQIQLNCSLTPGSRSGILSVTNYLASDTVQVNLIPTLTSINSVPSSGGIVTVTGYFVSEVSNITIGSYVVQSNSITIVDSKTIAFSLSGQGANLQTSLITNTGKSSNSISFSFIIQLSSYSHNGSNTLTLIGNNFGSDSIVSLNSIPYSNSSTTVSLTKILQIIPNTLTNGQASISSFSRVSENLNFKLTPLIDDITSVPTSGGTVTVFGSYLNTKRSDGSNTTIVIQIGSNTCNFISNIGDNSGLTCSIGAGTGANQSVKVTIDDVGSVGSVLFSYGKPSISSVTQNQKKITIFGENLGSSIPSITVKINNGASLSCSILTNDISLSCDLVQSSISGEVVVNVLGQVSNSMNIILSPILTSMKPASSIAQSITITGWFLRNNGDLEYSGSIDNTEFTAVNQIAGTDSVECHISSTPAQSIYTPSIEISINDKSSLNQISYSFSQPNVTSIVQNQYKVIINGNTFGNSNSTPSVTFGSKTVLCNITSPQTELVCDLPLTSVNSFATVSNYNGDDQSEILILTPILTNIIKAPTSGGLITIIADYINDLLAGDSRSYSANINGVEMSLIIENGSTINVNIQPGLPSDFTVYITVSDKISNTLITNYLNPIISEFSQDGYILTIIGENFGNSSDLVTLNISESSIDCSITIDHTTLECDIYSVRSSVESGDISVYRNLKELKSNNFNIYLTPILIDASSVGVDGGLLTINGYFLNQINSENQIPLEIFSSTVGDMGCIVKQSNNLQIKCNLGSGSHGINNVLNVTLSPNSSNKFTSNSITYSAIAPFISQVNTNGKFYFETVGLVTILGSNFISPSIVEIGNLSCLEPTVVSSKQITCTFNGSIPLENNYALNVTVNCYDLIDSASYFFYDEPLSCSPECINGGECVDGFCQCPEEYNGISCEIKTTNPITPPDTMDPNGASYTSSNLSVFFSHIREIDTLQSGKTVLIYPISDIKWNSSEKTGNEINSIGSFPGTDIVIEVKSIVFEQPETIYFAGERMDMSSNTLKYQVSVSGWTFNSSLNTLELIYALNAPSNTKTTCDIDVKTTSKTNDNQDNLRYIQIEMNDKTFVTKFSKRIIVDKRVTTSSTKLLSESDPIFQDQYFKNYSKDISSISAVALVLPSFKNYVVIDPNFYLLINPVGEGEVDCDGNIKKSSLWWIAIVVVGSAILIAGAVVGIYFYKKKQLEIKTTSRYSVSLGKM